MSKKQKSKYMIYRTNALGNKEFIASLLSEEAALTVVSLLGSDSYRRLDGARFGVEIGSHTVHVRRRKTDPSPN